MDIQFDTDKILHLKVKVNHSKSASDFLLRWLYTEKEKGGLELLSIDWRDDEKLLKIAELINEYKTECGLY